MLLASNKPTLRYQAYCQVAQKNPQLPTHVLDNLRSSLTIPEKWFQIDDKSRKRELTVKGLRISKGKETENLDE